MISKFIAGLVVAAISFACSAAEPVFYIGQANKDWAFNVTGKGKVLSGDTLIYADYEYIKIVNNPKANKSRTVMYVDLDYAYTLPDGRWDIQKTGTRRSVKKVLKPGEWMTVNWLGSKLSLKGEAASNYWLVVTVATEDGLVHAHSRRDILK